MKSFKISLVIGVAILFCSLTVWGSDVPQRINFQGILTDGSGTPLGSTTVDVEFKIYDMAAGGTVKWSETQLGVTTDANGRFNVLLGSANAIPDTAFAGIDRWLGIKITTEASEMSPRIKLVSLPYSYEFDNKGPDSTVSSVVGASFLARNSLSSGSTVSGVSGIGDNPGAGFAHGGEFITTTSGTGIHSGIAVRAEEGSVSRGIVSVGRNTGSGTAFGGEFEGGGAGGTGKHYGIFAYTTSPSDGVNYAIYDSGNGGSFGPTYGIYSVARNTASQNAYGGYFKTTDDGTGQHYGLYSEANATGGTAISYGLLAQNNSTTGTFHYGVAANAIGVGAVQNRAVSGIASGATGLNIGIYGSASGTGASGAYGGYFNTTATGSGNHYGLYSTADNTSPFPAATFGGYFTTGGSGTGQHFGLWSEVSSSTSIITQAIHAVNTSTTGSAIAIDANAGGVGAAESFGVFSVARDATDHNVGVLGRGIGTDPLAGLFDGGRVRIGVGYTTGEDVVDGTGDLYVADEAEVDGGLAIGQGGAKILKVLSASASLNFGSISAGGSLDLDITLSGAAVGNVVMLGVPYQTAPNGIIYSAFVPFGGGAVTVRAYNYSSGAIDPVSGTFRVAVMQF